MGKSERISNLEHGFKHLKEEGNSQKEGIKTLNRILQEFQTKLKSIEEISAPKELNKPAGKSEAGQDTQQKLAEQDQKLMAQEQKILKLEAQLDKLLEVKESKQTLDSTIAVKLKDDINQVIGSMSTIQRTLDGQVEKVKALEDAFSRLDGLESRFEDLPNNSTIKHNLEEKLSDQAQLLNDLQEQIARLSDQDSVLKAALGSLDNLELIENDIAGLQRNFAELNAKQSSLSKKIQHEEAKEDSQDEKIAELREEISGIETHIRDTKHQLHSIPENIKGKLTELSSFNHDLKEKLESHHMLYSKLEEQIYQLSEQGSVLEAKVGSFDNLEQLASDIAGLQRNFAELNEKQRSISEVLQNEQAKEEFQKEKLEALAEELQRVAEMETDYLEKQRDFQSIIEKIENRLADVSSDNHKLESELKEQISQLTERDSAIEAQLEKLEQPGMLANDVEGLQKGFAELRQQQSILSERIQKEGAKGDKLEKKINDLVKMQTAIKEAEKSISQLAHKLQLHSKAIKELDPILTSQQEEFSSYKNILNEFKEELAGQKLTVTNLARNEQSIIEDMEELESSFSEKFHSHVLLIEELQHVIEHHSLSEKDFQEEMKVSTQSLEESSLKILGDLQMIENDYKKVNEELMKKIEVMEKQIRKHRYSHYNSRTR
ncbi:hypothetical protein ACQCVH_13045 [Bacillus infantis]|uniref:hypothetical protein n=1 Tax=Bacillus infantis TaxID=324767 RepID=UPI003CED9E6E